jgi:MmgE/PrpD N-terminal domain
LAGYVVGGASGDIPAAVRKEASRTLLNWIGCVLGESQREAPRQASLLGRKERTDILSGALINGIGSHVLDFDDTHLRTVRPRSGVIARDVRHHNEEFSSRAARRITDLRRAFLARRVSLVRSTGLKRSRAGRTC